MVLISCFLGLTITFTSQTAELQGDLRNPFYTVPLYCEEEEKNRSSSLVKRVPVYHGLKIALEKGLWDAANVIVEKAPEVLASEEGDNRLLLFFIRQNPVPLKIVQFLVEAEAVYFKNGLKSLQRRRDALLHAVSLENIELITLLLEKNVPVTGSDDLLQQLVKNCEDRTVRLQKSRRATSFCALPECLSPKITPQSEDNAYNIAQLLVDKGAPTERSAARAFVSTCQGALCSFLRGCHIKQDDQKSKKLLHAGESSSYVTLDDVTLFEDEEPIR